MVVNNSVPGRFHQQKSVVVTEAFFSLHETDGHNSSPQENYYIYAAFFVMTIQYYVVVVPAIISPYTRRGSVVCGMEKIHS